MVVKTCRSIVDEIVRGIQTPERPSSPAELYTTEVQTFQNKNPKVNLTGGALSIKNVILVFVQNPLRTA